MAEEENNINLPGRADRRIGKGEDVLVEGVTKGGRLCAMKPRNGIILAEDENEES